MSEQSVLISPCAMGATAAVVGLGGGYVLAPRKYTLERLLMQSEDSFNKTFTTDVLRNATESELTSLSNLKAAAKEYRQSGEPLMKTQVTPNAKLWVQMVKDVNVADEFVVNAEKAKTNFNKVLAESNFLELKSTLKTAQEQAAKNPTDTNLNLSMKAAARDFAEAQLLMEQPTKNYRNARSALRVAREKAIESLPDRGKAIGVQWDKVRRSLSDRANVMYEQLATLVKNEGLQNDYTAIKKFIPKARTYSALLGAMVAGVVGTVMGVYKLNKIRNT